MARIYSVEQINSYIKNMFDTDFVLEKVSIQGEVSNCKYHTSGHIYFTVKDNKSSIAAVMFAGNRTGLKFKLEDGMQIVVSGNITIYERDGRYQIYARQIEKAGQGQLYERFLALKKELEDMGMFDASFKQPIPLFCAKVGIVTASTGAAIQDIINISTRRNPYVQLVLFPALVQGDGAAASICQGIKTLDEYGVDVIIIGRGGGSIEDLWAFNEESVARAVFNCKTPIISAVGHETDFTIADFVSDLRAPTPSAAAELAVCDINAVMSKLDEYRKQLDRTLKNRADELRRRVDTYKVRLEYLSPVNIINSKRQQTDELSDRLDRLIMVKLEERKNRLSLLCAKLEALSPVAKLSMGYAYARDNKGKALVSVEQVNNGDTITVNVSDGIVKAEVVKAERIQL